MMDDRDPLRESRNICGHEPQVRHPFGDQQGKVKWVF